MLWAVILSLDSFRRSSTMSQWSLLPACVSYGWASIRDLRETSHHDIFIIHITHASVFLRFKLFFGAKNPNLQQFFRSTCQKPRRLCGATMNSWWRKPHCVDGCWTRPWGLVGWERQVISLPKFGMFLGWINCAINLKGPCFFVSFILRDYTVTKLCGDFTELKDATDGTKLDLNIGNSTVWRLEKNGAKSTTLWDQLKPLWWTQLDPKSLSVAQV